MPHVAQGMLQTGFDNLREQKMKNNHVQVYNRTKH